MVSIESNADSHESVCVCFVYLRILLWRCSPFSEFLQIQIMASDNQKI